MPWLYGESKAEQGFSGDTGGIQVLVFSASSHLQSVFTPSTLQFIQ